MNNQLFVTIEMTDIEVMNRLVASCDRINRISHIMPRINTSKVRAMARTKQRTPRARKEKMKKYRTITITKNRYSR